MYRKYLWAVLRHKWFVFLECRKLGIPWLGIIHDLSKFLPSEFGPYARYFYGPYPRDDEHKPVSVVTGFNVAWLHHQHRNRHHWQRWLLTMDSARGSDKIVPFPMPDRYRKEMLADWRGAGRAYGNSNTAEWYRENRDQIQLDAETRYWLEKRLFMDDLDWSLDKKFTGPQEA